MILLFLLSLISGCNNPRCTGNDKVVKDFRVDTVTIKNYPLFVNRPSNNVINISVTCNNPGKNRKLKRIDLSFSEKCRFNDVSEINIYCGTSTDSMVFFGQTSIAGKNMNIDGEYPFVQGVNLIVINISIDKDADLAGKIELNDFKLVLENGVALSKPVIIYPALRFATILRSAGQDSCDTYRIPGIITTNSGALIAVYDNRYNNSKDLQEDIDIGMSRSTDGGQTWAPMKVIMDMGEYGGRSQQQNGIGDPCVLYDHFKNIIWVAALWMSGSSPDKMIWWESQPGMKPEETGQIILVNSTDDGQTWSQPVNITRQVKLPEWQLLLQGPGRGITMKDGTLVFPAQFKADIGTKALDGGRFTSHSTIVYSKDAGKTWHIGTGAKPNTTEAQVVELNDGVLMLNMRDDRNRSDKSSTNGRAVAITHDLGQTWEAHPSSNSLLPEPNCMASLISTTIAISGTEREVLFFSNPDNKTERKNMTVKASLDHGLTWPSDLQVEFYEDKVYGYSCLTMVDKNTLGILYEGNKEIVFQKIPVKNILKGLH